MRPASLSLGQPLPGVPHRCRRQVRPAIAQQFIALGPARPAELTPDLAGLNVVRPRTGAVRALKVAPATEIDAGGRNLANRDTLKLTALRGPDAEVRRLRPDRAWTEVFRVPRSYLARNAELGYGGNVHVAEGRTVDTAHLLVTDSLSRQAMYVGITRGRESNTAHVVTGKTVPLACRRGAEATSSAEMTGCCVLDS